MKEYLIFCFVGQFKFWKLYETDLRNTHTEVTYGVLVHYKDKKGGERVFKREHKFWSLSSQSTSGFLKESTVYPINLPQLLFFSWYAYLVPICTTAQVRKMKYFFKSISSLSSLSVV